MATFTPPIQAGMVPPYDADATPLQKRCMRHYASGSQGRNVYMLTNGTITEVDPDGNVVKWSDVAKVWWGGHVGETITAAQQTALTAAGYGAYIT